MLDSELLHRFMTDFFGYGNLRGDCWFIGIEEAGGGNSDEVAERLKVWDSLGANTTEDLHIFCQELGATFPSIAELLPPKTRYQKTWSALIRMLIVIRGESIEAAGDSKTVSRIRGAEFCSPDSDHCNLNLLPLPCPSTTDDEWMYDEWSPLPELRTRKAYIAEWEERRTGLLRALIGHHAPRLVVFYGYSGDKERYKWERLSGASLKTFCESPYLFGAQTGETIFVSMPHPNRRGMTEGMYPHFGLWIGQYAGLRQSAAL